MFRISGMCSRQTLHEGECLNRSSLANSSPPAERSGVGGVGRQAGGGPAASCTERRPNNTFVPPFTSPLPSLLRSLDLPQLRWGRRFLNPPMTRSEAEWEGSADRPGEGPPRVARHAVPTTRSSLRSPARSRSRCRSLALPASLREEVLEAQSQFIAVRDMQRYISAIRQISLLTSCVDDESGWKILYADGVQAGTRLQWLARYCGPQIQRPQLRPRS